jgi:hypothetical protein
MRANKRVARMRMRARGASGKARCGTGVGRVREMRQERLRGWRATRRCRVEPVVSAVVGPVTAASQNVAECRKLG